MNKRSKTAIIIAVAGIVIIAILILVFSKKGLINLGKGTTKHQFLSGITWIHYDESLGENLVITFSKDGHYSYHCECGEPQADSDIYEKYVYYPEEQTISLKGSSGERSEIKLLYADEGYLCLLFKDKGVTVFKNEDNMPNDKLEPSAVDLIETENSAMVSVLGLEDGYFTVTSSSYDADAAADYKDKTYKINAAKNVKYKSVSVKNDQGKETVENKTLTNEEYLRDSEFYNSGFVRFNSDGEIDDITFYGVLKIY